MFEKKFKEIIVSDDTHKVTFTLKNYHRVKGHDDTLPYEATLCANGVKVATCFNDGWGGETNVDIILTSKAPLLDTIDSVLKDATLTFEYNGEKHTFPLKLNDIADMLAYDMEIYQEVKKKQKKNIYFMFPDGHIMYAPIDENKKLTLDDFKDNEEKKKQIKELIEYTIKEYNCILLNSNIDFL
jgi:hypothetical protein